MRIVSLMRIDQMTRLVLRLINEVIYHYAYYTLLLEESPLKNGKGKQTNTISVIFLTSFCKK